MNVKKYYFLTFILLAAFNPIPSFAASQDECAIWLCLPAAFPSGCGAAKSAFKKRIKHHKSPLPAFSSCAVKSSSEMNYTMGKIVYIPPKTCGYFGGSSYYGSTSNYYGFGGCTPSSGGWVKDGSCPTIGCSTKRYIDIKVDGKEVGSTFIY